MYAAAKGDNNIQISHWGHACFNLKFGDINIITDPPSAETGYIIPEIAADIVTISHHHWDHCAISLVQGTPEVFDQPGIYSCKGVKIEGLPSFHDENQGQDRGNNVIFRLEYEGISVAHLGDLGDVPSEEVMQRLQGVDILLIPVGSIFTIDADVAYEITRRLSPRVVIPMHYQTPQLTFTLDPVEKFILKFPRVQKVPRLDYRPGNNNELSVVVLDYLLTRPCKER